MGKNKVSLRMSEKARLDIINIHEYIFSDLANPSAAEKLIDKFYKSFEQIIQYPESNPIDFQEPRYRKAIVDNYLIFYRIEDENNIMVYRILFGMKDYKKDL